MSSPHRFVVRCQEWVPPDAAGIRRLLPEKWHRMDEFRTAEDARKKCEELTAEAHRTLNPFHLGGPCLFYQTSLPPQALHDFLLDHGLTPPANSLSSSPGYAFWWVKQNRTLTDDQRAAVWSACDKLTLFDVIEEDDRQAVHVVMEILPERLPGEWDHLPSEIEGGILRSAYRSRRGANRIARLLGEERRQDLADSDMYSADSIPAGTELAIVCPIGIATTGTHDCWVVIRPALTAKTCRVENRSTHVPLVAYGDSGHAQQACEVLVRRARRSVNPFTMVFSGALTDRSIVDEWEDARVELPSGLTFDDALESVRKLPTSVPAPADDTLADWVAWYDRVVQWSPEYVDVIWGTFADFRLFEVIEVPLH